MSFQLARLDTFLRDISLRAQSRDESQTIDLEVGTSGLKIPMDPARLAQVFDNLLTNASKYAPGARITIALNVNDRAHIQVSDDGAGIAPDHLEHIFKRFYRVPSSNTTVRGTGLGLFICCQIVEAHGGEIEVESKLGKGTTFHIYLPLNRAPDEEQIF
jgi:signal transduction histidine kinase